MAKLPLRQSDEQRRYSQLNFHSQITNEERLFPQQVQIVNLETFPSHTRRAYL